MGFSPGFEFAGIPAHQRLNPCVRVERLALQTERERAQAILDPFALGKLLTSRHADTKSAYWVYLAPLPNKNAADKKTIQGKVHFVLPRKIGEVTVVSGVDENLVLSAIEAALT